MLFFGVFANSSFLHFVAAYLAVVRQTFVHVRHRLRHEVAQRQVRWYAQQIHITPGYLHQICKQVDGRSPQEVINDIVLHEIQQRLLATDDSVKQIAFALHFGTESSFSKFFRKQTGMSPTDYRTRL